MKLLATILVLLVIAVPHIAHAQDKVTATVLFKEGNTLRKVKKYPEALDKYQEAYRLFPSFKIQYNIALTLQLMGRNAEAVTVYQRFIREGTGKSQERMLRLARKKIRQLLSEISVVAVRCAVDGSTVFIDGIEEGKSPLGRDLYLAPGSHTLKVSHPGYVTSEEIFTVAAGQRKEWSVTLEKKPEEPAKPATETSPHPVERPQTPAEPDATKADTVNLQEKRHTKTVWAWSTLGVGLVCGVTAAALYGWGFPAGSDAYQSYTKSREQEATDQYWSEVQEAERGIAAGHVFVGLAAVALGVSIYQFATRPAESDLDAASTRPFRVGIALQPGGAGAMLSGGY